MKATFFNHILKQKYQIKIFNQSRSIQPALEEEQNRPQFNIREEIRRIDEVIEPEPEKFKFGKLIEDRPAYAHSRAFAAMLQMANEGKIR